MKRIEPHPLKAQLELVGLPQCQVASLVETHASTLCAQLRGFAPMSERTEAAIRALIQQRVREIVQTFPEEVAHAS